MNQICNGLCDCVNFYDKTRCEDEFNCEAFFNRQNSNFLNCTNLSLHCAAPKLENSFYTGGLVHMEKCVKIEFLCDGNADCLSTGFGLNFLRPLDELGCKSITLATNSSKSISGKG